MGVLVSVVLVVIAYHAVLFQGKTLDSSNFTNGVNGVLPSTGTTRPPIMTYRIDEAASAWQMVPWAQVTHREISHGHLPLWNPYEGDGTPLAANVQSAVYDPLMLVVNFHPTTLTWDLSLVFAFMLASVGTYLFLRTLSLGFAPAIAGTAAFVLCGYFAVDNNLTFAETYVYLPFLCIFVDQVVSTRKRRWIVGLSAATGGALLAGAPEPSFFVLAAAGIYALHALVRVRAARLAAAGRLALGGAAGVLLATPLLVLFFNFLPVAYQSHMTSVGTASAPFSTLLNWIVPRVNGPYGFLRVPSLTPDRSWIGGAGLVALVAAAASGSHMRKYSGWFFLGLGSFVLFKTHGVPVVQLVGVLPVVNRINFIAFSSPIASFFFAAVIAIAVQSLVDGGVDLRWFGVGAAAVGIGVLGLVAINSAVLAPSKQVSPSQQDGFYALALISAAVVALAVCLSTIRDFRRPLGWIVTGMIFIELMVSFAPGDFGPRVNPYTSPPWLALVRKASAGYPQPRVFGLDTVLYPDTAGALGLSDVRTLNALYLSRYRTYIRDFVSTSFTDRFTGESVTTTAFDGNAMFNLLGARVLLTNAQSTAGDSQYSYLGQAGGVSVFQNKDAVPRAFVASSPKRVASEAQAISYLRNKGAVQPDGSSLLVKFDPVTESVVEDAHPTTESAETSGSPRDVTFLDYEENAVTLRVGPGAPGLLVLTDAFAPGWQATANGKATPVLPVDVAFRGVNIGGGPTTVVLRYHPAGARSGWLGPLFALALLAAACAQPRVTGWRSSVASGASRI